jgi:hypothetical protein
MAIDGQIPFTFYGDLLGVSSYYKLAPRNAHKKLDDFYNTSFFGLSTYCQRTNTAALMFSDSLLLYGRGTGRPEETTLAVL